jgi:phosphoenolpyruvate synthase/pyruvate phosphate dikinase
MNNPVLPQDFDQYKGFIGNKTLNLKKCLDWGFTVPEFIALPSSMTAELFTNQGLLNDVVKAITDMLPCQKYAVRSSALIEDGGSHSLAGQFLTKINLTAAELSQGIQDVLKQANTYLKGDLNIFSIIVQDYITADISGVTFTRNPNGSREMVLEYGFCAGEKIVSGEIKPNKTSLYWNQTSTTLPKPLWQADVLSKFKELENKYGDPQDIDWCLKDNKFYLLQTRPITTLTSLQYEQIKYLETALPQNLDYYFEKTEISEIAPRPSTITHDLLELIYADNGPVANVYRKYGVKYENTGCLKIIGNELYIDKEKEIRGLLPAYSYLRGKDFIPKLRNFGKLLPTIKNLYFLNKINTGKYENIFSDLKNKIESKIKTPNLNNALSNFLSDY